jgi:hypothetical protein
MKEKEIAEIRRRLRPEKNNITHILGCYVNEKREIISLFNQSLVKMPQEEFEAYMTLFRRALSGPIGKNLIDIAFSTEQVVNSIEHKLLMALRDTALKDEEIVRAFYEKVIRSLSLEGNYLILLAHDTYDVPFRGNGEEALERDSNEIFPYILCSICPVVMTNRHSAIPHMRMCFITGKPAGLCLHRSWVLCFPPLMIAAQTFIARCTIPVT